MEKQYITKWYCCFPVFNSNGISHWGKKFRINESFSLKDTISNQTCDLYLHEGAGIRFGCSEFYICMDLDIAFFRFLETQYNYHFAVLFTCYHS